jgi:hypothetical protein
MRSSHRDAASFRGDRRSLSEAQERRIRGLICDRRPEQNWGDETALVNTDVRGRSYAPAGKAPVTYTVPGTRHKLSMIATVTNQGKTR